MVVMKPMTIPMTVTVNFEEATPVTNKVEKGQKYQGRQTGKVYEVLDVIKIDGTDYVIWREPGHYDGKPQIHEKLFGDSSLYTLIREPKFKVGDRVKFYGHPHKVVAVSSEGDYEGEFSYIIKDDDSGEHDHTFESRLKAAE